MSKRITRCRLAPVILTCIASVMLILSGCLRSGLEGDYRFYLIVDDVDGIAVDMPVMYIGIRAGSVRRIQVEGKRNVLTILMLSYVKIPKGSRFLIQKYEDGNFYIDIVPSESEHYIPPETYVSNY